MAANSCASRPINVILIAMAFHTTFSKKKRRKKNAKQAEGKRFLL